MTELKELSGDLSLGGIYTLHSCIRQDGEGAWFAGSTSEGGRCLIKLVSCDSPGADSRFALWQRLRHLRHPNLIGVLDVRRCEIADRNYISAVFEYPDDVLASGLVEGALSESDTRVVLEAALSALRYLHGQGLVHGVVDADHIVAVGDAVKLTTDWVRESADPAAHAGDMRQLAELAATLRAPVPLSESLAAIVRDTAIPPREAGIPPSRSFPKWIVVAVAALLVLIVMFNLRRRRVAPHSPRVVPAAAPAAKSVPPVAAPASPAPGSTWRVIAFTYRAPAMAARKAKQINSRWPGLHASVFEPKESRGYYLVALGDRMNRETAARLQSKARSMGLPRDTYMQNYSE